MRGGFQLRWMGWGLALGLTAALAWMSPPSAWPHKKEEHANRPKAAEVKKEKGHDENEKEKGDHHAEETKPHGHAEETKPHGHAEEAKPHGHAEEAKPHGHAEGTMPNGHGTPAKGLSPLAAKGFQLVSNLHCNACHYVAPELKHGMHHAGGHGAVAPDLSFPGDKFRPDWLYGFLRKPHPIRPWLKIRMPSFRLTEEEAVALVRHLSRDMRQRRLPPLPAEPEWSESEKKARLEAGRKLMSEEYFGCWECHQRGEKKPEGPMENWAPDLEISSRRLRPEWIVRWLKNPQQWMPGTKMPSYFEDADSGPEEILDGDETKQIYAIRDYILSLSPPAKKPSAFEQAKQRYPKANRAYGARLMSELNCAGCHEVGGMHEREEAGPPLAHEGSRVKRDWLVRFLKKPSKYRPLGYVAGAASRMPDFRLSEEEARAITAYFMTRMDKRTAALENSRATRRERAQRGARLYAALRCEACHRGARDGKRPKSGIHLEGPDLSHAGRRLKEKHLRLWLAGEVTRSGSELEMDAHPLVPKLGLTREQIADLAAYLVTRK